MSGGVGLDAYSQEVVRVLQWALERAEAGCLSGVSLLVSDRQGGQHAVVAGLGRDVPAGLFHALHCVSHQVLTGALDEVDGAMSAADEAMGTRPDDLARRRRLRVASY